jgi:hypothetical protein
MEDGLKYNYELLAMVAVVEDIRLEREIKEAYRMDKWALRINKDPISRYGIDN